MKTFAGAITKKALLKEIKWHRTQDMILQGTYGSEVDGKWRGCAVGCAIHSINRLANKSLATNDHRVYETELGIPEWLARLEDSIFEGLPKEEAIWWPERFIAAVPEGVDLELVRWKFGAWLMQENIARVQKLKISESLKEQVLDAIRQVLAVHEAAIKTGKWDESAARSAESAARSVAESARSVAESARSVARSAESAAWFAESVAESVESARSAARSAESARSAAESAWSAAESARSVARSAESAARSAESAAWFAESVAYTRYAKKLTEILKETK